MILQGWSQQSQEILFLKLGIPVLFRKLIGFHGNNLMEKRKQQLMQDVLLASLLVSHQNLHHAEQLALVCVLEVVLECVMVAYRRALLLAVQGALEV